MLSLFSIQLVVHTCLNRNLAIVTLSYLVAEESNSTLGLAKSETQKGSAGLTMNNVTALRDLTYFSLYSSTSICLLDETCGSTDGPPLHWVLRSRFEPRDA